MLCKQLFNVGFIDLRIINNFSLEDGYDLKSDLL